MLLDKCSFSDPRVKSLSHLSADRRSTVHFSVIAALQKSTPQTDVGTENQTETVEPFQTKGCILSSLLPQFESAASMSGDAVSLCRAEVERYERAASCPMDQDPLAW